MVRGIRVFAFAQTLGLIGANIVSRDLVQTPSRKERAQTFHQVAFPTLAGITAGLLRALPQTVRPLDSQFHEIAVSCKIERQARKFRSHTACELAFLSPCNQIALYLDRCSLVASVVSEN